MTREDIAEGLSLLVMILANEDRGAPGPPNTWRPHDWAYIKGVASGEILRLRDRLIDHPQASNAVREDPQ